MPLAIPPELKPITAYIRRSEELDADKSDPQNQNISYYCRTYAMEKAMQLRGAGSEGITTFLLALMQDLEARKAIPGNSLPSAEAKCLCEAYAVGIFHRADEDDRSGDPNHREVARTFYNAQTFFDIIEQFGPLDEELASKRTYSKWKATEIMKALKEGRTPAPGGYGGDDAPQHITPPPTTTPAVQNLSLKGSDIGAFSFPPAPTNTFIDRGLGSPPSQPINTFQMQQQPYGQQQQPPSYGQPQYQPPYAPQQQYQPPTQQQQPVFHLPPPPQQPQYSQPPPPTQFSSHQPHPNYVPPPKFNKASTASNIADALELCAFAMSALKHNDSNLGRERLREALNLLS